MRISRIFSSQTLAHSKEILLDKDTSHYVMHVLRLKTDDAVILFDGSGYDYSAVIMATSRNGVQVKVQEHVFINKESPLKIHLGQVIAKGEKMDLILQKSVELGVNEITPLFSQRCDVKLPKDRIDKKMAHWQAIIISACEQSGRSFLPKLHTPIAWEDWARDLTSEIKLILHPANKSALSKLQVTSAALLVGPEGGFSTDETEQAIQYGFQSWTIGPRILRTETAALVGISLLQAKWGDYT